MTMNPDYQSAATKALEILIERKISKAPVDPLPIVKGTSGVIAMPFADLANDAGMDRGKLIPMFGENQDAITIHLDNSKVQYVVAYNQYLPFDMIRRGLARELGHIVLGHTGSKLPTNVRMAEAMTFARHLLFPRPLIHAIQEAGIPFTVEVVGSITGCYERCLTGLYKTPGVHTDPQLNRAVRNQFADCIENFVAFQHLLSKTDGSKPALFGSFMDLYEE